MGHDVFISYSSHDKKVADLVCALVERRGHRCWIAPRDIMSGLEWGKAIVDAIREARVFVLIFSANANRSPQVNREVERAVNNGLAIIPFRIEAVTPSDSLEYFISNQHWLDAVTPPLSRHVDHLGDVIGRLLGTDRPAPAVPSGRLGGRASAGRGRAALAVLLTLLVALASVAAYWFNRGGGQSPPVVASAGGRPGTASTNARPATPPLEPLLDFAAIPVATEIDGRVDAASYLRNAAVPVVVAPFAASGTRLAFIDGRHLWIGPVLRAASSTFLVLDAPNGTASTLELQFGTPLQEVRLSLAGLAARTVIREQIGALRLPALTFVALDRDGRILARKDWPAWYSYRTAVMPAPTIALQTRASGGIYAVRILVENTIGYLIFDPASSDGPADAPHFVDAHGFAPAQARPALVLEAITVRRMAPRAADAAAPSRQ